MFSLHTRNSSYLGYGLAHGRIMRDCYVRGHCTDRSPLLVGEKEKLGAEALLCGCYAARQ